ncbi:putative ribonuclease H-like domain-containing protein, partial [Tanacetum coccineum]
IENLIDLKVKVIRCDNGTEFKNRVMNQFYEMKGIKREFSVAMTPQQNRVAKRKNRTIIEASKTMLADSKLPTTFWAKAVNTACYVQIRVLVIKSHNKTPYELFLFRKPALSFMRPFGCPITILNTIDHLGKFDGKADEGFFVGYSTNSKAFIVFNSRTKIVEENLHVQFSTKAYDDACKARLETVPGKDYILLPLWTQDLPFSSSSKDYLDAGFKPSGEEEKKDAEDPTVNAAGIEDNAIDDNIVYECADDPNIPYLEEIGRFIDVEDDDSGADMNNLDTYFQVSPVPTIRIHKDNPLNQIIGDLQSATQTRQMTKSLEEYGFVSTTLKQRTSHKDLKNCLFVCFLSQEEPKKMDVNSAFLYGKIKEEVYVCQPPGFEDPDFPDIRGKIDKTLFIRREKGDILLVQVYVDDIIFGSTKKSLCIEFEKIMHKKFQMSSMDILKKFGFNDVKTASTPMETHKPLLKDADEHLYRSMIGSLMYLTSSRPDIMFAVCTCARYQVNLKVSHFHAVKRIFIYLKRQPKLGLWYPKDSPFDLVAYTDSDYAGASLDRKSTTRGCQFLRCRLISWQCNVVANSTTEVEYIAASNCCGQFDDGKAIWNGIGVNAGNSKLILLGINLLLLGKVNAARHNLLLLLKVNAARHKLTTAGER